MTPRQKTLEEYNPQDGDEIIINFWDKEHKKIWLVVEASLLPDEDEQIVQVVIFPQGNPFEEPTRSTIVLWKEMKTSLKTKNSSANINQNQENKQNVSKITNIYIGDAKNSNIVTGDENNISTITGISQQTVPPQVDPLFDAGERIQAIRTELGLNTGQFFELIGMQSEGAYKALEKRETEAPLSLLRAISNKFFVRLEWLKNGEMPKYRSKDLPLDSVQDALVFCKTLKPFEYFLTLNENNLHVGLVAHTDEYCYQVIDTGVRLDFWMWGEAHWIIPIFYNFLKQLSQRSHDIAGVILPDSTEKSLFNGEIHFLTAQAKMSFLGMDLLYDLLDVNETRNRAPFYKKHYGGDWMIRVHDVFRKLA